MGLDGRMNGLGGVAVLKYIIALLKASSTLPASAWVPNISSLMNRPGFGFMAIHIGNHRGFVLHLNQVYCLFAMSGTPPPRQATLSPTKRTVSSRCVPCPEAWCSIKRTALL